jgi:hypothetical protein
MKNTIILILSIVCLFVISSSFSIDNTQIKEVGTYQIATKAGVLYRLNTKTGEIFNIKESSIEKINLNSKRNK